MVFLLVRTARCFLELAMITQVWTRRITAAALAAALPLLGGCHDVTGGVFDTIFLALQIAGVWI